MATAFLQNVVIIAFVGIVASFIVLTCIKHKNKHNSFIVDMVCENPYRCISYSMLYIIGNWNLHAGLFYLIALVMVDIDIEKTLNQTLKKLTKF